METTDTGKAPINIKVPRTLKARLRAEAGRLGVAEAALIVMILDQQLPEHDPRKR